MPSPVPTPPSTAGPDPTAAADAERIRRRYPRSRLNSPAGLVALGVAAAASLGWLVWAAADQATPPVSGRVDHYVISEQQVDVTVSIERPDPSLPVVCLLIAQAQNFERVGEVEVELAPGTERQVQQVVPVRTFRKAAAASLDGCRVV